jgi:tetratricopeptide (TPR) repeat protein
MSRFSWDQEHNIIRITVPCSNPIINKKGYFDLFVSRCYVKFHLSSPKMFMDFDLILDIDPASSLNKTIAHPNHLELVFSKLVPGEHWPALLNPDKTAARARREASLAEIESLKLQAREAAEKKKIDMDRLSVSEQMRIDGEKRKVLEDKMSDEKSRAVREIFADRPNTQIFKERTDLPETRTTVAQQLKFTPKRDPNLPARESMVDEPPIPNPIRPLDGPVHETHPLFLKDKADGFLSAGDYVSAINAYTKALKVDRKFVAVLLNLSVCYMRTFEFDLAMEVLAECEKCTEDEKTKALCWLRKGAVMVWQGKLADGLLEYRRADEVIQDETITSDIIRIERRSESNVLKNEGDDWYAKGDLQMALNKYLQSIDLDDENELSYANLAQVCLKLRQEEACLQYCDKALDLITHNKKLKCKVLLRKAKATGNLQFIEEALVIDSLNADAKRMQAEFKERINNEQFDSFKAQADEMLKQGKAKEALKIYKQLSGTRTEDETKVNLLTNMCACYLIEKDYQAVVRVVQKALKLTPKPSVRLRLLCRRAKAYGELGQLYSAQCDLKEALVLDPQNTTIQNDLALLKAKE